MLQFCDLHALDSFWVVPSFALVTSLLHALHEVNDFKTRNTQRKFTSPALTCRRTRSPTTTSHGTSTQSWTPLARWAHFWRPNSERAAVSSLPQTLGTLERHGELQAHQVAAT